VERVKKYGTLHYPRTRHAYNGQAVGIMYISDGSIENPDAQEIDVPIRIGDITPDHMMRVPGDVGNATSFPFPVQYKYVTGVTMSEVLRPVPTDRAIQVVQKACQEFEREGVQCICTGCGFFAYFQPYMNQVVDIPVFSSALLQVPMASIAIAPRKVAIMTANAATLTERHLLNCGITDAYPYVVWGMERYTEPHNTMWLTEVDMEKRTQELERRLSAAALDCIAAHPDVGAFVLECTNMPPASHAIQQATGMPVFDIITLVQYAHSFVIKRRFSGYM